MTRYALLVEDELLVAFDLQDIIEEVGLDVDGPHTDVAEADAAISRRQPDIAVLDVSLRDGEVFPVADRLRELGVPIIFHSGHADEAGLVARYPGASVCSKPCSPSRLAREIEQLIDGAPGA